MGKKGTHVPFEVPSLLNPTTGLTTPPGSTSPTLFEQWCGFFYVPREQITESAVRRDLRSLVLISRREKSDPTDVLSRMLCFFFKNQLRVSHVRQNVENLCSQKKKCGLTNFLCIVSTGA